MRKYTDNPSGLLRRDSKGDIQGWLVIADPNEIYLPKEDSGKIKDRIQFTYLHDNFTESKAANYSSTAVLGRSEPIRGYVGSTPRTLNLQLAVPIEGDGLPMQPNLSGALDENYLQTVQTFKRKLEVLDFIRALVYPHYTEKTNRLTFPPPRVLVILGQWFSMLGIVTNFSMTHKSPWASQLMAPYLTEVNLAIEECDQPYSFKDVITGKLTLGGRVSAEQPSSPYTSRIG